MLINYLPQVRLLGTSNLDESCCHSVLISVLRGLAAVQVVAAHVRAQTFPSLKSLPDPTLWYQALAFFTGFAHQAVVIFFLLSGWLVGGSLLNKLGRPGIMLPYAIDRLTRIWIVLVPAFLLTLLLAVLAETVDPRRLDFSSENPYSVTAFVGNLLGVQDMAVPRYGGNFALWSLANEIWYYVLFPLVLLAFVGKTWFARSAAVAAVLVAASYLSFPIMLYFAVWLLGVGASRVRIDANRVQLGLMLCLFFAVAVYFRLTGSNDILVADSFIQDVLYSLAFLVVLCSLQFRLDMSARPIRALRAWGQLLAAFSFTLYVTHVPILLALRGPLGGRLAPDQLGDLGIYFAMLLGIMLLAYLFHLPFEAQTYRVRRKVRQFVLTLQTAPPSKHGVDVG